MPGPAAAEVTGERPRAEGSDHGARDDQGAVRESEPGHDCRDPGGCGAGWLCRSILTPVIGEF
jgi:hypothetical protein